MKNRMTNITRFGAVLSVLTLSACGGGSETETTIDTAPVMVPTNDWNLVWSDEFDGTAIDSSKWTHEVNCAGGGNQELQCYTDSAENSFVSDGTLKIVAKLNDGAVGEDDDFTSARMTSQNKGDFKYGRIEMRAKMPKGQGTWPAFWMMPTDSVYGGWPKSGEIDIVEAVNLGAARADGTEETNIYGTIHYGAGPASDFTGASHTPASNPGDSFNTYAIEWQEGEIRWYFNDRLYATQRQSQVRTSAAGDVLGLSHRGWYAELYDVATGQLGTDYSSAPFDQDFFMIMNLAVGGSWPASVNEGGVDASVFADEGQTFEIDYVRVYKCPANRITGAGCETTAPGYDVSVEDGGMLVDGRAPTPSLNPGAPDPITIFDDTVDVNWVAWDCCGGSTPSVVADDAERGNVYEFTVENGNDGTVFGFITRSLFLSPDPTSEARPTPHNALGMINGGYVTFDVKVTSAPTNPESVWKFKIEADEATGGEWETDLVNFGPEPVVGEWATYRVPLQDVADAGVDLTLLDVIMVFPAWQTGDGAVFRMDNVAILQDTAPGQVFPEFPVSTNADWALWDCCGGSTPEVVQDAEKGQVARFAVENGNDGTVLGFNTRGGANGGDAPLNVAEITANGVLSFDMKVNNAPEAGNGGWLIKIESNANQGEFVEVNLNTSNEGVDPSDAWQTFTFNITDLLDNGTLDPTGIDVIMIFPAWQTGAGAVYEVGNLTFSVPGSGSAVVEPLAALITDEVDVNWALWDCCGGSTPAFVADADKGQVVEFAVLNGNSGTVLGINSRSSDGGTDIPVNATSILNDGVLRFDLKVVNAPAAGNEGWLIKLESNANQAEFVEVNLNTSNEGVNPSENWQTFTFDLLDLVDAGTLDPSAIDVIMIFPAWQTGADAVYRVDNLEFISAAGTSTPSTPSNGDTDGGTDSGTDGGTDSGTGGGTDGGNAVVVPGAANMTGLFGGITFDASTSTYVFPASGEVWAGVANLTDDLYPLSFPNGGTITFTGAVPADSADVNVKFLFENEPNPNNTVSFETDEVTVSGSTEQTYTVTFGAQDAEQTYSSFIMYLIEQDLPVIVKDVVVTATPADTANMVAFEGATRAGDVYTFTGQDWAGFSNDNEALYPFSFPYGGEVTFTGMLATADDADVNVRFRFERLPHPDVDPAFDTEAVTVTGTDAATYTVSFGPQASANTFSSFLMYLNERDAPVTITDIKVKAYSEFAEMTGIFGGALHDNGTFTYPTGAEAWGGFANENPGIYPISLPLGGKITFMASLPEGGTDTNVRFRLERLPFPDVEPSVNTEAVTVTGTDMMEYTIEIPAQAAENTYRSLLMYINEFDSPVNIADIKVTQYTNVIDMSGVFGGATKVGDTFTFPTDAEGWGGFANDNTFVYPFSFPNGGTLTFTAAVPEGQADTNLTFRFERLPFPDVDPAFSLDPVTISGSTETEYTVTIPAQAADNTFSSMLMYVVERDMPVTVKNIIVTEAE